MRSAVPWRGASPGPWHPDSQRLPWQLIPGREAVPRAPTARTGAKEGEGETRKSTEFSLCLRSGTPDTPPKVFCGSFLIFFPPPAPVATLGRATESRSTGRERWSKARHFPHHCGAGQSRELLRKTDSPSARPGSRGAANRARPGDRPPRPAGGSAAAPLPGPSSQNAAETKAERSPCCNSRGPGRERVPNRARRAQRRAGLEVDKILRPFHSHIKQTPFLCLKKKKSVQQNKLRRNRERCLDSGVKETPSFPHIRLWFV